MIRTDLTANESTLRELFSIDKDDPPLQQHPDKPIATHDGAWYFEYPLLGWRFWKHEDV